MDDPYIREPVVKETVDHAKRYLVEKEQNLKKQGKELDVIEKQKTIPFKKKGIER